MQSAGSKRFYVIGIGSILCLSLLLTALVWLSLRPRQGAGSEPPPPKQEQPVIADSESQPAEPAPPPKAPPTPKPTGPPPYARQSEVNGAIERGLGYLRTQQKADGLLEAVGNDHARQFRVGSTALAALTFLECGVAANDAYVEKTVAYVRSRLPNLTSTYELALGLLLFDRLADPTDKELITRCAMQLIVGQNSAGGWDYHNRLTLSDPDWAMLRQFLEKQHAEYWYRSHPLARRLVDDKLTDASRSRTSTDVQTLPQKLQTLPVVRNSLPDTPLTAGGRDDNSNTQFAILGLWAARRHGIPTQPTFAGVDKRFRAHRRGESGWAYVPNEAPSGTMTCAGLLGLAVGYGTVLDEIKEDKGLAHKILQQDADVQAGLKAVTHHMKIPEKRGNLVSIYFLWSLERVAHLYHLNEIGGRDWYAWGADMLLDNQRPDGSWDSGLSVGTPLSDTCLALLFLRRQNLVADLSQRLTRQPDR